MNFALGPLNTPRLVTEKTIRDELIRMLYRTGVRVNTIADVIGMTQGHISQTVTRADRAARKEEIKRRDLAICARRLGEFQLLRSTAPGEGAGEGGARG